MAERLKQLLKLMPASVRELSPAKLFVLLGLLGLVCAVGVVSLLWMSGEEEQQVLYTQLTVQDAAAITTKLKEMGVSYTIKGDGTTILVPASMVYDVRLRLATEGLPQGGGVGFELFDQRSFGMTEFMQKLNYQRALQGELARTIAQLAAVQNARVHIVLPEKSLFVSQQEKTTASVVLKLVPGRRLTPEQIRGIVHLVSSSVEGLAPTDVTVVDTNGQILSRQEENTTLLAQTEAQLAHQRALEQSLERRVQSLLERAVGEGKVLVRVSATLDFQHIERTEERFDAENPAIRSEQRSKEEGSGPGFWAIGVPGVRSNTDASQQEPSLNTAKTSSARQSETVNYELSKMVSKIVAPSGEVKHLSVAVLVDGAYQPGGKKGERTYVPRSAEELAKYRDMVKGAIGYNEARGDRVEVANIPFEARETPEESAAMAAQRFFWLNLGRYGAYVLLGLLFFLFVGRPVVKWITGGKPAAVVQTELPRTVQELEADMGVAGMLPEAEATGALAESPLKLGQPSGQELRTQIAEYVRSEPEQAVEVLRAWLRG
jgi:flagellar M-ring protein FliF